MVHSQMTDLLELCDGSSTWDEAAAIAGVDVEGDELQSARSFIDQLDAMGYFDTDAAAQRRAQMMSAWSALEVRPPVCAGSTYPEDAAELKEFLATLCANETLQEATAEEQPCHVLLMPHIDFRVSGAVYGKALEALRTTAPELVVMIGTSHYWSDDLVVGLDKHVQTPLGVLHTDRELMKAFAQRLRDEGLPVWGSDLAHKPEHSLELHAVLLQHAFAGREFNVLPILVTGISDSGAPDDLDTVQRIANVLRGIVEESGKQVLWMVSGDLSHMGLRFGHDVHAAELLESSTHHDHCVLEAMQTGSAERVHHTICNADMQYNVCGHSPAVLALLAAQPTAGHILGYDQWHDEPTGSAVGFGAVAFPR